MEQGPPKGVSIGIDDNASEVTYLKRARLGIQASYLVTAPLLSNSQKAICMTISH